MSAYSNVRVILVEPSHPGNIGAVARAMKTMRLARLVLVAPKVFPSADATARAAGADDVLYHAEVCETLAQAVRGCAWVVGTSARARHLDWPQLSPREAAAALAARAAHAEVAMVFGRESSGLSNEELGYCHAVARIPTDPAFRSLNVASAVQILGYELELAVEGAGPGAGDPREPVTAEEMEGFYEHLRRTLIEIGYYDEAAPKLLLRRLRRMFNRLEPDRAELNILRGILSAVQRKAGTE